MPSYNSFDNNKRIAKNSFFLYLRMGLLVVISFYTSRVVLKALGVVDFGLFNVVGGCVAMLGFIQTSMTNLMQRYFSYSIERPDIYDIDRVYSACFRLIILLSIIILVFTETIGLWFVLYKLTIPPERYVESIIVYQLSVFQAIVMLFSVPYSALIVSNERMKAFAYISIIEALTKLLIAFILTFSKYDKLCFYAVLLFITQSLIRIIYVRYSKKYFKRIRFSFTNNYSLEKEMLGYAGWSALLLASEMIQVYGINILLNLFMGPIVNAARGIAMQVMGAVRNFSINFLMAVNPQIIKSYASGNFIYLNSLISRATRFGFYLIFAVSLPVILITEDLLIFWLGEIPPHTSMFVKLIIVSTIIMLLLDPLKTAICASGNIKGIHFCSSLCYFLTILVAYVLLKAGSSAESVFVVQIVFNILMVFIHIYIGKKVLGLCLRNYVISVIIPIITVTIFSTITSFYFLEIFEGLLWRFTSAIVSVGIVCIFSYYLGITKSEKAYLLEMVKTKLFKTE